MDPRRTVRLSESMREELEEIIAYELSDPRVDCSGIADVVISPDARHAHIRLILQGDAEHQKQTLEALNRAKGFIKTELAIRLDLFRMPELHFEPAVSAGLGERFEHLLKRVKRGRPRDLA
ncbi:MAG: 30S ribosome-binding factor RbfA [Bryobacteraceae bacterium]